MRPDRQPYKRTDRIDPEVKVQLTLPARTLKIIVTPDEEDVAAPTVKLAITPPARLIDLTSFTIEELDLFEKVLLDAIARARPICEYLDNEAESARLNGDGSFKRLYRPRPTYVELEIDE